MKNKTPQEPLEEARKLLESEAGEELKNWPVWRTNIVAKLLKAQDLISTNKERLRCLQIVENENNHHLHPCACKDSYCCGLEALEKLNHVKEQILTPPRNDNI